MKPWMLPGPRHRGRYLLAPLTGKKEGSKSLVVIRVKPSPTQFPTNSLYTPIDNTPMLLLVVDGSGRANAKLVLPLACRGRASY